MSTAATKTAERLEALITEDPDAAFFSLREATQAWRTAGSDERAVDLLQRHTMDVTREDGELAALAHLLLAELFFDVDRNDEAYAHLDKLRKLRPATAIMCLSAAKLLEVRYDLQKAMRWYNIAVQRMDRSDLHALDGSNARTSDIYQVLAGRYRVRRMLGLTADRFDVGFQATGLTSFASEDEIAAAAASGRPAGINILFWPRSELPAARKRWPSLITTDADGAAKDRERGNREIASTGTSRIVMIPLSVSKLDEYTREHGGDFSDEHTRKGCLDWLRANGHGIPWPPEPNAACWCGADLVYQKCCGAKA